MEEVTDKEVKDWNHSMETNSKNVQARLDAEWFVREFGEQPKRFWEVMKRLVEEKLGLKTRKPRKKAKK